MITKTKIDTSQPRIDMSAPDPLSTVNRSACARALKLNVSNVSRILSKDPTQLRVPRLHTFYKLSRYLGIDMEELYRLLSRG